jgi:hypothetical protein
MSYQLSYRALQAGNAPRHTPSGAYASANPHLRGSTHHGSSEASFGTSAFNLLSWACDFVQSEIRVFDAAGGAALRTRRRVLMRPSLSLSGQRKCGWLGR